MEYVTAVQGLKQSECGTVLEVTNPKRPRHPVYVIAVDNGGKGLDLNKDSFAELNGDVRHGLVHVRWKPVNSAKLPKKAIRNPEKIKNLPGYTDGLSYL
ncbi:hypothetical protein AB8O64_04965 [Streptomyces sp. QH1-20]|uniref:hypothetical protein n=1 Tax=Streptomyces sp. QH1-20 TaxID=3240934 RepID=UPI0035144B6E